MARVLAGLDTTTRPARLASTVAIAHVLPVTSSATSSPRAQALRERPHLRRSGGKPPGLPHHYALPNRYLRELAVHIQPDTPPL